MHVASTLSLKAALIAFLLLQVLSNVRGNEPTRIIEGHTASVLLVAFSHDETLLASADSQGVVCIRTADGQQLLHTLHGHHFPVRHGGFVPGTDLLVSAGSSSYREKMAQGELKLWNTLTGEEVGELDLGQNRVLALDISTDGRKIVCAVDGENQRQLTVWDIPSRTIVSSVGMDENFVSCVAFNADGSKILSGGTSGKIRSWKANTGELEQTVLDGVGTLWAVDQMHQRAVITGVDRRTRMYDLATGKPLFAINGEAGGGGRPISPRVFSSPDALVLGSFTPGRGLIQLLNGKTGAPRATLRLNDRIVAAKVSSNHRLVAAGTVSGRVAIWESSGFDGRDQLAAELQARQQDASTVTKIADRFLRGMRDREDDYEAQQRQLELARAITLRPLQGISVEEIKEKFTTNVSLQDDAVRNTMKDLAESLGWRLSDDPQSRKLLERKATLVMPTVSPIVAMESLAKQIDARPVYPPTVNWFGGMASSLAQALGVPEKALSASNTSRPVLAFAPGGRSLPVLPQGPILIAITKLQEHVGYATGRVDIEIRAPAMPPQLRMLDQGLLDFESALGDDGQLLSFFGGYGGFDNGQDLSLQISLRNLLRDVTKVTIQGKSTLKVPTEIINVEFESLAEGASRTIGDGEITIRATREKQFEATRFGITSSMDIFFEFADLPTNEFEVLAFDAQGLPLQVSSGGGEKSWGGSRGRSVFGISKPNAANPFSSTGSLHNGNGWWVYSVQGVPNHLTVKVISQIETLSYPVSISIPLRDFVKQPEELVELRFERADVPVQVEVIRLLEEEKKVDLALQNVSNKDVERLRIKLNYHGQDGEILTSHDANVWEVGDEPLVRSGATVQTEETVFFMPDEATHVTAEVREIRFMDFSEWERE